MSNVARLRPSRVWSLPLALGLFGCAGTQTGASYGGNGQAVAWPIDNTQSIGGYKVTPVGAPKVERGTPSPAVCFGGGSDGLVFPVNPLDAQTEFTIQVLFKPDPDGPAKQQFLHLQDKADNRLLMEIRLTPDKRWYLHSFVRSGDQQHELAATELLHGAGEWYWVALTYADGVVTQFVDAQRQEANATELQPMHAGEMSVGIRLTNENGFKGCIRELRFATEALAATELARDVDAPSVLARSP